MTELSYARRRSVAEWRVWLESLLGEDGAMYKCILVPIDLADTELAKPAISTAKLLADSVGSSIRLVNVLPLTPVMLAEYVPPDFEAQQRKSAEDALAIICKESGFESRAFRARCARAASIRKSSKRRRRSRPTSSS